ncbi:molybdenum cofactor guanylyltransferase [Fictibacillus nanhaiensis]|uniref:molybdenum cofactor guanylyltransferase n=1 Tax=Fictibacillus nanhaiensis TaxID=742169 RepID=UPI001C98985E|nr:molybdenum cofactor guanylyltransferase [Fictibacillus nanhaiensis]MBY6035499.1 molybdenum cofactor guanylyltransferase [Fictibacillus nanhaiensis]
MDNQVSRAGIILAGGASRRFGSPKAIARWEGKTFIERAIDTLTPFCDTILVVAHHELMSELNQYSSKQVQIICDDPHFTGKGPLAGMYSGMTKVKADYYLVSPCDMPLMSSEMYQKWLDAAIDEEYECVVPVLNGKIYPLNGIYTYSCLLDITFCLQKDIYKVLDLLNRKRTYFIKADKDDEAYFKNVNTVEDLHS